MSVESRIGNHSTCDESAAWKGLRELRAAEAALLDIEMRHGLKERPNMRVCVGDALAGLAVDSKGRDHTSDRADLALALKAESSFERAAGGAAATKRSSDSRGSRTRAA
jgi:hypothetical protein